MRYERTLQEAVLRENGMLAADSIEYQVTNGKNRMPAFEGRLSEDEITNVAVMPCRSQSLPSNPMTASKSALGPTMWQYYVVEQSQAGWNKNPKYVNYPSKYVSSKLAGAYANAAAPMAASKK